jgi:hypothetical protein
MEGEQAGRGYGLDVVLPTESKCRIGRISMIQLPLAQFLRGSGEKLRQRHAQPPRFHELNLL